MASVSGRPSTPPANSDDPPDSTAPLPESTAAWGSMPHIYDIVYAVSKNLDDISVDVPAINLRAASVDSSKLLGHGASFTASVQPLPSGPATVQYTSDMGSFETTRFVTAPPRPKFVVYKTARVAFDDNGNAQPQSRSALRSVILEIHALTYPSLLQHPNVIAILGFAWGTNEFNPQHRLPALVLEYADLGTLMDVLKQRTLPPSLSQALCFDVASGLEAIHAAGLAHGDIKAENVLVCTGETRAVAKLADFGYSVVTDSDSAEIWIGGTIPWKAPETSGPVPMKMLRYTDIYSLGLLIWLVAIGGRSPVQVLRLQNNLTAFEALKRSDQLLQASQMRNWAPQHMGELIRSGEWNLTSKDLQLLNEKPAAISPNILESLRASVISWWNDNPLLAKLNEILSFSLRFDPQLRSLSRIRDILQPGVQPAEKHISRRFKPKLVKTTVLNKSGETRTYNQVSAWQPNSFLADASSSSATAKLNETRQMAHRILPASSSAGTALPQPKNPVNATHLPNVASAASDDRSQDIVEATNAVSMYDAQERYSWKNRGYGRSAGSWQGMRKITPRLQEDIVSHLNAEVIDSGRQFLLAACKINGYGCPRDSESGLHLIRRSANAEYHLSQGYFYRLHRGCGYEDRNEIDVKQYLVQMARIGSRAARQDLTDAGMSEEADVAGRWIGNRTGGVGAAWYSDPNMLNGLTLGSWLDHEFLKKTAKEVDDINSYRINKHGDTLLHMTAACGEHKSRKFLVDEMQADINARNSPGETPLLSLCRAGQGGSAITFLRQYNADASIAAPNGETPLHWLISFPDASIKPLSVDLVLKGARVDAETTERISYSVFPSRVDFDFQMPGTPLLWAVHHDRPVAVQALLDQRANPLHGSDRGIMSPIQWAAFYHHTECLKLMIEYLEQEYMSLPSHYGDERFAVLYQPLVLRAVSAADKFSMILRNGHRYLERLHATLDLLREKTVRVHLAKSFQHATWSLLYFAVAEAHDEVVQYMFDHEWYIDELNVACGDYLRTPFLEAVRWNRRSMVELLVQHGADVAAKSRNPFRSKELTWTALHVYADEGFNRDISLVPYLIHLGLKVDGDYETAYNNPLSNLEDLRLSDGPTKAAAEEAERSNVVTETPFSCALRNNAFKLCDTFLRFGADPNALSSSSGLFTSPFATTILGHVIITNARYSHARLDYLLSLKAAETPTPETEKVASSGRVNFIVEPTRLLTALHRAALGPQGVHTTNESPVEWAQFDWDTNRQIMRFLLHHFNTPDLINTRCSMVESRTALHMAVQAANISALELLLEVGADKEVEDVNGLTALDLAVVLDEDRGPAESACLKIMVQMLELEQS